MPHCFQTFKWTINEWWWIYLTKKYYKIGFHFLSLWMFIPFMSQAIFDKDIIHFKKFNVQFLIFPIFLFWKTHIYKTTLVPNYYVSGNFNKQSIIRHCPCLLAYLLFVCLFPWFQKPGILFGMTMRKSHPQWGICRRELMDVSLSH